LQRGETQQIVDFDGRLKDAGGDFGGDAFRDVVHESVEEKSCSHYLTLLGKLKLFCRKMLAHITDVDRSGAGIRIKMYPESLG
jgi:hypothetical protein